MQGIRLAGSHFIGDGLVNENGKPVFKPSDTLAGIGFDVSDAPASPQQFFAAAIQTNVLPMTFPPYPDLADQIDLHARMITAKKVGGDFYDFYFVSPGRLALVIVEARTGDSRPSARG